MFTTARSTFTATFGDISGEFVDTWLSFSYSAEQSLGKTYGETKRPWNTAKVTVFFFTQIRLSYEAGDLIS